MKTSNHKFPPTSVSVFRCPLFNEQAKTLDIQAYAYPSNRVIHALPQGGNLPMIAESSMDLRRREAEVGDPQVPARSDLKAASLAPSWDDTPHFDVQAFGPPADETIGDPVIWVLAGLC
ncbi:hypothetical protein C8035_v006172 [Colletotrichum spinosum]|uniref:Uncharacterized protein n=1 Tax=Colletotrichum spinosum TaxID=1347390 RepID=A0A4R8Q8R5_9PEZI|nr:hypothetical protein C8035_v006172 [Colletotrichum spinosum]